MASIRLLQRQNKPVNCWPHCAWHCCTPFVKGGTIVLLGALLRSKHAIFKGCFLSPLENSTSRTTNYFVLYLGKNPSQSLM